MRWDNGRVAWHGQHSEWGWNFEIYVSLTNVIPLLYTRVLWILWHAWPSYKDCVDGEFTGWGGSTAANAGNESERANP